MACSVTPWFEVSEKEQGQSYVLAVPANEHVWVGSRQVQGRDIQGFLPEGDWETLACRLGPGPPLVRLAVPGCWPNRRMPSRGRYLLFRCSRTDLAYWQA